MKSKNHENTTLILDWEKITACFCVTGKSYLKGGGGKPKTNTILSFQYK